MLLAGALGTIAGGTGTSYAEDKPEDATAWKTMARVGFTLTSGNSDTLLATASIQTQKKWDKNAISLGASGGYGENDGTKNSDYLNGYGQYDRSFSDRFYGYARVDAMHDAIADVEYRVTLSPGAGYYFVKSARFDLRGEVGPGVVFEKLGNDTHSYYTLRLGERLNWKINDRSRLWQSVEYLPQVDDFSNYLVNAEAGVETDITKKISLQVFVQDSYRSEPAPSRKNNDVKLVSGIAYRF